MWSFANLIVLILALVVTVTATPEFFRSYLGSFLFWLDLPLGALALLMISELTGGKWGQTLLPFVRVIASSIYLFLGFFIPIAFGMSKIFSWMQPSTDLKSLHRQAYLNPTQFLLRAAFYFIAWSLMVYFMKRWRENKNHEKLSRLSAGGLVLLGLTVSFAAIDWQMSIENGWYSTIYGLLYLSGQALTAYSFALICLGFAKPISKKTSRDLGNLLLAFVMMWAYLAFMQYLIIWNSNLPHEVTWYRSRTSDGWQWLALVLICFQFIAPFLFLLFRSVKESSRFLAVVSGMVFLVRILDHYWMLTPGFGYRPLQIAGDSLLSFLIIGFVVVGLIIMQIRQSKALLESPSL